MSKRLHCYTSAIAVTLASAMALPAEAQTAAEIAARRDAVQERYALAQVALKEAENRARAVPDDSLVLHGSIVRFNSANLEERERQSVTRAFDLAASELTELFGPDGSSLLDGQAWLVTVSRSNSRREASLLGLEAVDGERRMNTESFKLPLNIPATASLIRRQAGRNLVRAQPVFFAWVGGFRLAGSTETHYFAHKLLALHQSTPARRCARGNIPACTDILDERARARWFEATDEVNRERVAAGGMVRESVLRYAVEVNGPAVLRAFQSPVDTALQPVPFLAAAVGQDQAQFVAGWQSQLAESGGARVRAIPRTVLAAFGWFALCGIVATRRRPR